MISVIVKTDDHAGESGLVVFLFFRFLFLGLLLFRELLPFCFFVPPTYRFFSFCRCQEEQFFVYCSGVLSGKEQLLWFIRISPKEYAIL